MKTTTLQILAVLLHVPLAAIYAENITPAFPSPPAKRAAATAVSPERMRQVYDEVKTPFKYGVVLRGEANQLVDSPSVFRKDGQWYMVYIASVGNLGYETCLARSKDLLHWEKLGKILSFRPDGWDRWQRAGYIALGDPTWGGSNELQTYDGKYWMSYLGGSLQGYETDPLAIGLAWTKTPAEAVEWTPISENPVLTRDQPDVRPFEKVTLYKSNIIWDKAMTLGAPFVMYYNGKISGGYEQIGMAVSDDMVHWKRYGTDSVMANGEDKQNGISGDPQVVKMGDLWVMFYFGAGWRPGAFDTFACSTDLVNWTKWTGPDLVQSSESWDKTYAHKPWIVKHDGVVYHFYCAVGDQGRVIALATSKDLKVPDLKAMRTEVEALAKLTQAPKYQVVERGDATPNLKPILYAGPEYQGKPTKVFAWLGLPQKREGKVPAVVLVHGGGGTASKVWVQNWNKHGYAAISMSLEGHTDNYTRLPDGGPSRPGIFGDSAAPIRDQWMYQCVADATLAAALLRSLPEVDPGKIGIVGCSWGGIITSTVIGIDPRYAFAIPVYGCGGLDVIPNQYGASLANNEVYKQVWDANLRLDRARMPILWLSWPQDTHFPMDALALSSKKAAHSDSSLCLIPGMGHGNLTDRPEWFAFADSVLKEGRPWMREKSSRLWGGKVQATFNSTKPLDAAVLVSTTGSGHTGSRKWIESPATLSRTGDLWVADAAVPEGTTACFINVKSGPLTASSDYFAIKCR